MKNINVCLLAAVACTYSIQVAASSKNNLNLVFEDNVYSLLNSSAASHTVTPLELKPILLSNNSGIKLAAVCHITDAGCTNIGFVNTGDDDIDLDNATQCRDDGYNLTSCPGNQTPENFCPFSSKYFRSCKCPTEYKYTQSSCNTQFPNSSLGSNQCNYHGTTYSDACVCNTATYPYTASTCNGKEELTGTMCKDISNITYASACTCIGGDAKYQHTDATCKSSHSGFANWTVNDDICKNKATDCVCTPTSGACSGYSLDSDTCGGGYKVGESCNNGCQLKWKCKDLCPYKGTLASCPDGYVCTLEACSTKFYISGCRMGDVDIEKCTWYSCWMNTYTK